MHPLLVFAALTVAIGGPLLWLALKMPPLAVPLAPIPPHAVTPIAPVPVPAGPWFCERTRRWRCPVSSRFVKAPAHA